MSTSLRDIWLKQTDGEILQSCRVDTYRASGPGGQKRNKTSSAVRLTHVASGVSVIAEESRSQHENKARALRRLRLAIALHVRNDCNTKEFPVCQNPTNTTLGVKLAISPRHPEFPMVVGWVLDIVYLSRGQLSHAARSIGCSTGQLSKFLVSEPKVLAVVNKLRAALGIRPLRDGR